MEPEPFYKNARILIDNSYMNSRRSSIINVLIGVMTIAMIVVSAILFVGNSNVPQASRALTNAEAEITSSEVYTIEDLIKQSEPGEIRSAAPISTIENIQLDLVKSKEDIPIVSPN